MRRQRAPLHSCRPSGPLLIEVFPQRRADAHGEHLNFTLITESVKRAGQQTLTLTQSKQTNMSSVISNNIRRPQTSAVAVAALESLKR